MASKSVQIISGIMLAAVVAVFGASKQAEAAPVAQTTGDTVRILVKANPEMASAFGSETMVANTASANVAPLGWQVVEVNANEAPAVLAQLQADSRFAQVTPDYPLELTWTPDDPGFVQGTQWALDKLGTDIAWEFSSGESVTVAVLDSGIDANHPDLVGHVVEGFNFYTDNTDTTDLCGHGTAIAGIIAATANNGLGIAGIAYNAKIMPIKVIDDDCVGSYSRLMEGIVYAVDHGVRIISITSGGGYDHVGLHEAIQYAESKGALVVVSAGNRGSDEPFYPGSYVESFTVAGTDENDNSFDKTNFGQQIDLSAPATTIYSTYFHNGESTYAYMSGTSVAAPQVVGVAALVLAMEPELALGELQRMLVAATVDLGEPGWDPMFGAGRISATRAVAAIAPATGNIRAGHVRVANMPTSDAIVANITVEQSGLKVSWTQAETESNQTVVVYRATVPVFEGALDIAEVAAADGAFVDSSVQENTGYYYWLVVAEEDVEFVSSSQVAATFTTPVTPTAPVSGLVYIPMVQR